MDWNDLKYFLAVAQGKTLTAAAVQLGVSPSTVSRRIDMLEQALNVRLFHPHQNGYDLTPAGHQVMPIAERTGAQMRVFQRTTQELDEKDAGPVSIEAPEILGQEVILPSLGTLMGRYPGLRIKLRTSVNPVRLAGEESDIILRIVRPEQGPYKLRKLGQIQFQLYASHDYVERYGSPTKPDDLYNHHVIGWTEELHYLTMARWLETTCPGLQPTLRLTSLGAQIEAAKQGYGWAVLPSFAADPKDLVTCLKDFETLKSDLWLLVHQQTASLQRVTTVRDYLVKSIEERLAR